MPASAHPYRIRMASNRDSEAVRDLVFGVLAEYGLPPHPAGIDADLADLEGNYLRPGGMFEVVEAPDGAIVGSVGLLPLGGGICELRKMYLAPGVRGHGLGKRLLQRSIDHARRLGFRRMVLETAGVLKDAIRLYTRAGFQPVPRNHITERCDQAFALDL